MRIADTDAAPVPDLGRESRPSPPRPDERPHRLLDLFRRVLAAELHSDPRLPSRDDRVGEPDRVDPYLRAHRIAASGLSRISAQARRRADAHGAAHLRAIQRDRGERGSSAQSGKSLVGTGGEPPSHAVKPSSMLPRWHPEPPSAPSRPVDIHRGLQCGFLSIQSHGGKDPQGRESDRSMPHSVEGSLAAGPPRKR